MEPTLEQNDHQKQPPPSGWKLLLLIALLGFFPTLFHPWWLFVLSIAVFSLLVWLLVLRKENPQ